MDGKKVASLKSLLLRAWRERWPDMHWSIHVKQLLGPVLEDDVCNALADLLLQQALIGSSPNPLVLSYLQHAVTTQMITFSTAVKHVVNHNNVGKVFCMKGLLELVADLVQRASACNWPGNAEDSVKLAQALLTLLPWLLGIIHTCLQKIAQQKMQAEYSSLIEQVCGILSKMSDNKISCSLLYISRLEDPGLWQKVEQSEGELWSLLGQQLPGTISPELRARIEGALALHNKLGDSTLAAQPILNISSQMLNLGLHTLLEIEVMFSPNGDTQALVDSILVTERLQGLSRADLYCELLRACFMGLVDSAGGPEELKWVAFTFIKLPNVLQWLSQNSSESSSSALEEGMVSLLNYMPLMDLADTKCQCNTLQYLIKELIKLDLITDAQRKSFLAKRQHESHGTKDFSTQQSGQPNQQPSVCLVLRAEPTVTTILKTLDADYSKNQDALLGVLCHMMSGKSFELILSAAAATGKLQSFAVKLVKFNEFAKYSSGEMGNQAQIRAWLFDFSFIMLCHITQIHGTEIISCNSECSNSFFVQWARGCLPEDGRYKALELQAQPDPSKVDVLLRQISPDGELSMSLTRWYEVCQNMPYAIQEVLYAWEHKALSREDVMKILDNMRSRMCCLPIVVSAWLCSYLMLQDKAGRQKPLAMLQQLMKPCHADPSMTKYYAERSTLMHKILQKIIQDVLPPSAQQNPMEPVLPPSVPAHTVLKEKLHHIMQKGSVSLQMLQKLNQLLTITGPEWFSKNLVQELLSAERPEDLSQGVSLVYALFHMSLPELTLALLHHTVPMLLQGSSPRLHLLTDPRGRYLAKLCAMCLAALYRSRQKQNAEGSPVKRGKKRTRSDIELEEQEDGVLDSRPNKMRRFPLTENAMSLETDGFELEGLLLPKEEPKTPSYDTKEPLNKALVNLFWLLSSIMGSSHVSQRTGFVMSFLREILHTGDETARFCLQFLPANMVTQLLKTFPREFEPEVLLSMCDLTDSAGRQVAAQVLGQYARLLSSDAKQSAQGS